MYYVDHVLTKGSIFNLEKKSQQTQFYVNFDLVFLFLVYVSYLFIMCVLNI